MQPRPVVLGLLGGIGSGKSIAAQALAARGAVVLDADAEARALLGDPAIVAALVARHGPGIVPVPGRGIDRAVLARATFGKPDELRHLEVLLHPRIRRALGLRLRDLLGRTELPAIVLDVPLLLESPAFAGTWDLLLHVDSTPEERRQRVMERRGWDAGELARREAHQLAPDVKRARADVVLPNHGPEAALHAAVGRWLDAVGGFPSLPRRPDVPAAAARLADGDEAPRSRGGPAAPPDGGGAASPFDGGAPPVVGAG